jgi:hypothetical protein
MHQNEYTEDKNSIIDATGKAWPCNEWHAGKIPTGIDPRNEIGMWTEEVRVTNTHWLSRAPLPPVPVQAQQDEEMFDSYHSQFGVKECRDRCLNIWRAALAWERSRNP